ncbi:MAG: hypothetical protein IJ125_00215 [Atopobiaceae bacterium]|nr:hypothetical protein [Atopobiaceae bacterium]
MDDADNYEQFYTEIMEKLTTSDAPVGENPRDSHKSQNQPTVSAFVQELKARGFDEFILEALYERDGSYRFNSELEETSDSSYPVYTARYISNDSVMWEITCIDGVITAVPTYLENTTLESTTLFVEDDRLVQYDAIKNEYSDFNTSSYITKDVNIVVINRLDKANLDSYTKQILG